MGNIMYKELYEQEEDNLGLRTQAKNIVKMLLEQQGQPQALQDAEKEDFSELMYEVLRRVRQIPLDKTVSPRRIKEILSEDKVGFDLNSGADLNEKIHREYNRVRFYEYSQQLLKAAHSKGVRGHYFEGLLAGLFNGEVVTAMEGEMIDPKEDVVINGIHYSAKLVRSQDKKWDSGSLFGGWKQAIIQLLIDKGIDPNDFKNTPFKVDDLTAKLYELIPEGDSDRDTYQFKHMELFLKDSNVDNKYKEIILKHAFTTQSEEEEGEGLNWIFGLISGTYENFEGEDLPTTNLKYYLIDTPSLITGILDGKIEFTKGRNAKMIRIKEESMIGTNGASSHYIIFPKVSRQDLRNLLYDENSEEMVYKVMGIFKKLAPGTEKYMHHKVADVIKDNPQEFIKALQAIFPDKDINESLLPKLIKEDKSESKGMTPKLWNVVRLVVSMLGDEAFTSRGESSIDFNDVLGNYFNIHNSLQTGVLWLIITYNAKLYGITQKEVINLPAEKIQIPENMWEGEFTYFGAYEDTEVEDECVPHTKDYAVGEMSGEECDCDFYENIVIEDKNGDEEWIPCEEATDKQKQEANVDECECEEWEYKSVQMYYYPVVQSKTLTLTKPEEEEHNYDDVFMGIENFGKEVIFLEEDQQLDGEYSEDETWENFNDGKEGEMEDSTFWKVNPRDTIQQLNSNLYGGKLTEESDIFGQGLLDLIEPEEFEGDEEEWETLVDDVEDDSFEPELEYSYKGGKTDAEKGFVAPSKEVTDNICKVKGFCSAQGPITFGQLRTLVEEATSQRIKGDIGRGVFKSLWRIIPFFIPQVLLAAVGVTVTRAFNKIITPALKDTRGYKSWWGKAVLKAMDVAEGDYIPDVALGDDPISKIFFISDGLLQMIRDKYKLKFARYVAEVASNEPDNKPVPEWFVENLLRNYLNQKFLLDPPLQIKQDIEKNKINEAEVEVTEPKEEYEQFTKLEITIMNYLVKQFTRTELRQISDTDYHMLDSAIITKYGNYLKYFGIPTEDAHEDWARGSRFAKWITDNWNEAEVEMDGGGYSHDFNRVTNPIKDWPNMYEVRGVESGWERTYRSGYIEIPAYDEGDASDRAHEAFWDYDPDMETDDYGDYESDDFNIDDSDIELNHSLKEDSFNTHSLIGMGSMLVKAIFTNSGGWGRAPQKFIIYLTTTGVVKDIKRSDSITPNQISFKVGDKVGLGALIRYEKQSGFELQMVGRLHEHTKEKRINNSIKTWINKEFNLVLDHNNVPTFLSKNTEKLNTYAQVNNLVCEIWGKEHNYKLDVNEFSIKNIDIKYNNYNNLVFENLTNGGVTLPLDTLKHYLNKNIKKETKDNILEGKKINLNKLHSRLIKLGFVKENQPKQRVVLEWLNVVIKETNKNGVITEEGKIKYVDNLIESYNTQTPPGLGIPQEVFLKTVETLKPEVLKDLKPLLNDLMYHCLGLEDMAPDYLEGLVVSKLDNDIGCSESYNRIWDITRELERKLINMGILEPTPMTGTIIPDSLINFYTQLYSEIDQRLKSDWSGMPVVNKEVQKLTEDIPRAHSYSGGRHTNPKEVEVDDVIRLIHMDDPQGIAVGTYGTVVGFDSDPWEKRILVVWDLPNGEKRNLPIYPSIDTFMIDSKPNPINEQMSQEDIDKQLTLFPTGQWEFTAHEDPSDAKFVEKTISDDLIKILFNKWDEDGIDLKIFKYLGIPPSDLVVAYVVKRYLQNTKKPVPVSYTFNCDDLAELFDTHSNDYDFDYIKEYLCGDDSFWDSDDWYHYEWDGYMTDSIDENNWKTISEIFGGVSQEVVEHILTKQPQNEEEEELIEKYDEEIDEIQNFIIWANNDEAEYATKDAMARDIDNELATHFQEEGRLVTDDNGKKSWVIEGDLRDYVNDQWDNTDTFEFHTDRMATVLEDIIMDLGITYFKPDTLFGYLMEEEFMFGEYCEGKKGDCLQPETKFFDGYWTPDIDINESLADRLVELHYSGSQLTYEPQVTTPEGETKPLQENQNIPHWRLYQLLKRTSNVSNHRRKKVFDFLNVLQNLGLVNMYQSPDFLWSGSKWLTKYLDLKHPELLEEPDELLDFPGDLDNERIQQVRYLLDNADTVRDIVLMMLMDSTEDPSSIKVETQMRPFATDLVKLWAETK